MSTSKHGYLILTDITDYTAFLSSSELEHAQDILQGLMKVLLAGRGRPEVAWGWGF